jgi:dTDP-4-amino-4,6-dideoxygalactose transaminase
VDHEQFPDVFAEVHLYCLRVTNLAKKRIRFCLLSLLFQKTGLYMQGIKMVDLKGQYDRISDEIREAIEEVINSTAFINGPAVGAFRDDLAAYLDVPHVIPCGNGTDALQVALMALDLKPGDEVITTPFSFIASIEVIRLLGLVPVLVDVDPATFNMDPGQIGKAIGKKTKAIIPVHLFGQCADMEAIMEIADKHGLFVVEDAAQALGADYLFPNGGSAKAGTIGNIGATSFFPSKNLGAFGDGGAIMTEDAALGKRLKSIVNHGSSKKYYYDHVGVNSRLDTLQAAILRVKLRHLPSYHAARQAAAAAYDEALGKVSRLKLPKRVSWSTHIFHQYTITMKDGGRDDLADYLRSKQIPVMVYYPLPLHLQKAYQDLGYASGDFPVSESLCANVFSIPMHTELGTDQIEYICHHIEAYLNR